MTLQAGALDGFGNFIDPDCMARYMDDAMPEPIDPTDPGKKGRREFLIALSTGIIEYLKAHDDDSFRVGINQVGSNWQGTLEIF